MQSRSIVFIQPNDFNKIYFPFQSRNNSSNVDLLLWKFIFSVVHVHPLQTTREEEEDAFELLPYDLTFCLKVINV